MRVGVVGAGISGLAAGRELAAAGHAVVVFDSHDLPGGRLACFRSEGYVFDMGATAIAPRGKTLERVIQSELDSSDLECLALSVSTHTGARPSVEAVDKKPVARFAYRSGNDRLAHLLADGLDLRLGRTAMALERTGDSISVQGEEFDALIVATPAPEAVRLLATVGQHRPLGNCAYRMCLSVAFGFDRPLPSKPHFALMDPAQRHPLTWVSFESLKCPGRAPAGCSSLVAQLSAEFSAAHFDYDERRICTLVLGLLQRMLGPGWDSPVLTKVFRWPYSHPENIALFETVNHPGDRLVVAGDSLAGARVEYAYDVGVRAAHLLLEKP